MFFQPFGKSESVTKLGSITNQKMLIYPTLPLNIVVISLLVFSNWLLLIHVPHIRLLCD